MEYILDEAYTMLPEGLDVVWSIHPSTVGMTVIPWLCNINIQPNTVHRGLRSVLSTNLYRQFQLGMDVGHAKSR